MGKNHSITIARYQDWSKAPHETAEEIFERQYLWNLYVDAREGWKDGTTAKHSGAPVVSISSRRYTSQKELS